MLPITLAHVLWSLLMLPGFPTLRHHMIQLWYKSGAAAKRASIIPLNIRMN